MFRKGLPMLFPKITSTAKRNVIINVGESFLPASLTASKANLDDERAQVFCAKS